MTAKGLMNVVNFWQDALGLCDWEILVDLDEAADDDNEAQVSRSLYYDRADMRFSRDWKLWPAERLNQIVAHELLHLVTRDLDRAHAGVEGQVHPHVWSVIDDRYTHEIEGVVDRLAGRLVALAGIN